MDIFVFIGFVIYFGICCRCYQKLQKFVVIWIKVFLNLICFYDLLQGWVEIKFDQDGSDFVIQCKDGLFVYYLVVVLDDVVQGVMYIVCGCDLLDFVFWYCYL